MIELGIWLSLGSEVGAGVAPRLPGPQVRPHLCELGMRMAPSSPIQPVFRSR